jgi:hypothetical protein
MLKDPNHKDETPYELLNLPLEATRQELHQALPRFMRDRRNLARLGRAQEAVRKLQNAKARAGIDIWFYESGPAEAASGPAQPRALVLDEFRQVPALPPQALYTDLDGADRAADSRPIDILKVKISDVRSLDGVEEIRLRPDFDR